MCCFSSSSSVVVVVVGYFCVCIMVWLNMNTI